MFGIGTTELLVILLIALLLLGPKRLPEVARFLARLVSYFRQASDEVREHFEIDTPYIDVDAEDEIEEEEKKEERVEEENGEDRDK